MALMGTKLISICILTLPNRLDSLAPLIKRLQLQVDRYNLNEAIEILYLGDNKARSVGEKRNALINLAQGENVAFIDDDDEVSDDYVESLFNAVMLSPEKDAYCFRVEITVMGKNPKAVYYSKDFLRDQNFKNHYHRIPNHLMLVKTELAREAGYLDMNHGEDANYSKRLLGLLRSEVQITKTLYYYRSNPYTSETLPENIKQQVIANL